MVVELQLGIVVCVCAHEETKTGDIDRQWESSDMKHYLICEKARER